MERDKRINQELLGLGWTVLRFWDQEIKTDLAGCVQEIEEAALSYFLEQATQGECNPSPEEE